MQKIKNTNGLIQLELTRFLPPLAKAGDSLINTLDLLYYNIVNKSNRLPQLFLFIKIISSPAIAKTV